MSMSPLSYQTGVTGPPHRDSQNESILWKHPEVCHYEEDEFLSAQKPWGGGRRGLSGGLRSTAHHVAIWP